MPCNKTNDFAELLDPEPCAIIRSIVQAGYEAYLVGGAVRDLLLGEKPKDYDIATSATPEQVRAVFGRRKCHVIGHRFRLALVFIHGTQYEVSTFRKMPENIQNDEATEKGEEASSIIWNDNTFGNQEEDATRRDFTVNAIYYDVVGKRGFIDYSGGLQDIKKKMVKCIGDPEKRFAEDPVRMLRALKLCGQYGFKLSADIKKALKHHAEKIHLASKGRLFEELMKILMSPKSLQILTALQEHGFLQHFWSTLAQSWDEDEGIWLRKILEKRDARMLLDPMYPHSKALALSTVTFPFLMSALSPGEGPRIWDKTVNAEFITRKVVQLVFSDFAVPKVFQVRIQMIMFLVPRLMKPNVPLKALKSVEFGNGLALADVLVETFAWNASELFKLHDREYLVHAIMNQINEKGASQAPPQALPAVDSVPDEDEETAAIKTIEKLKKRHKHRPRHRRKGDVPSGEKATIGNGQEPASGESGRENGQEAAAQ